MEYKQFIQIMIFMIPVSFTTYGIANAYFYYTIPPASQAESFEATYVVDTINATKNGSLIVTDLQIDNSTEEIFFIFNATNTDNATLERFQCSVDSNEFEECSSPVIVSLKNLTVGQHSFEVRAIDTDGKVEPQPATHLWNSSKKIKIGD